MEQYSYIEATHFKKRSRRAFIICTSLLVGAPLPVILVALLSEQKASEAPEAYLLAALIGLGMKQFSNRFKKEFREELKKAYREASNFLIEDVKRLYGESVFFFADEKFKYFPRKDTPQKVVIRSLTGNEVNYLVEVSLNSNTGEVNITR